MPIGLYVKQYKMLNNHIFYMRNDIIKVWKRQNYHLL